MNTQKQIYNKRIVLATGKCKKCGGETCVNQRLAPSPKQLRKNYYFSKVEICTKCKAIWLKEEDKVFTKEIPQEVDIIQRLLNKIDELEKENKEFKKQLDNIYD